MNYLLLMMDQLMIQLKDVKDKASKLYVIIETWGAGTRDIMR